MALVNLDDDKSVIQTSPTGQMPVEVPVIHVTDPKYNGVTVDNRWVPTSSLLQHVAGFPWTIDYYSQVVGTDSALGGQRPTSSPIHQQYTKITGLIVRVVEPLAVGQDPDDKSMTYIGKAIIGGFLIPNEGDMFTADIGTGAKATFRVMLSEKKAVFQEAVYEITYEIGTDDSEFIADLEEKVVRTLVYRADLHGRGGNPLIISDYNALLDEAQNVVQSILNQYFSRFFSTEFQTLIVPGQPKKVYDPYLVQFMLKLLTPEDTLHMQRLRQLNVQDDPVYKQNNLWQALLHQDELYLQGGFTRAGLIESIKLTNNAYFSGIRFSGVELVVYPVNPTVDIGGVVADDLKELAEQDLVPSTGGNVNMFEDTNTGALPNNASIPGLYRVTFDDRYVLSQNFYGITNAQSVLEQMTRRFIKRETLDLRALMATAKAFNQWGLVEQFYYLPIVLTLIRCGKFNAS